MILAFFVYLLFLLLIGFMSYQKQKSSADFIVGGRSSNFWVIALSAHASDMSSWLFMALPAAIYIRGLSELWTCIGLFTGMLLTWQFVAKKLRTSTEEYHSYTLSSFFEKKFGDESGMIRLVTALATLFFMVCYLAAGLIGMGRLLESIFHLDYAISVTFATAVVVIYTFYGGFTTVVWTDLFQALFLLLVIMIVPIVAYNTLPNGLADIQTKAAANQIELSLLPSTSPEAILTALSLFFGWGLGYFGQPHIITKFMGIKKPGDLVKSKYVGLTWQVLSLGGAVFAGLVGIAYFHDTLPNPELLFVEMATGLFHPFIAGVFLCGVVAATVSTMDSQILICASVIGEDLYKYLFNNRSPHMILRITRGAVIIVSLAALFLALNKNSSILEAVQYAWTGLGCSFGPLVLTALHSRKANRYGAMAGIIVGSSIAAFWNQLNPYITVYTISAMIPGVILGTAAIYIVSALTATKGSTNASGV